MAKVWDVATISTIAITFDDCMSGQCENGEIKLKKVKVECNNCKVICAYACCRFI
jgi:hypothetical protein